jgi:hypothetical protein
MAPRKRTSAGSAGPKGRKVRHPLDERSPADRGTGGYDPDDYHGRGPVPIGNAAVHPTRRPGSEIEAGIEMEPDIVGNPGDVPDTQPRGPQLDRDAPGESTTPDEVLKQHSSRRSPRKAA